ncbi:Ldh family oxidoreductase [Leeia oryzae]|uniref:Ldh family oxidoreductase n=1 Tax=Leeia oryzae TaxID=356662 RepID=UPI000368FAEB|nr:Ldh family oxidoreductase [Leeia oryzae]
MLTLAVHEATVLCTRAAIASGAAIAMAESLAKAIIAAELRGKHPVGIAHFFDYLEAIQQGRIDGFAAPVLSYPTPMIVMSDAKGGIAQLGFDLAFEQLVTSARQSGITIFSQKNAYTCGELGYFAERLAKQGLIALAFGNSPALLAAGGATKPVYGTNPFAFAAPLDNNEIVLIDQASSATAFVSIRAAAAKGENIPAGWAMDDKGQATNDPAKALMGSLLPFGGMKGGNIALMVEILAALSGANWSLDAPDFLSGRASPGVGLTIIGICPALFSPDFCHRLTAHTQRLNEDFNVHIPGQRQRAAQ